MSISDNTKTLLYLLIKFNMKILTTSITELLRIHFKKRIIVFVYEFSGNDIILKSEKIIS